MRCVLFCANKSGHLQLCGRGGRLPFSATLPFDGGILFGRPMVVMDLGSAALFLQIFTKGAPSAGSESLAVFPIVRGSPKRARGMVGKLGGAWSQTLFLLWFVPLGQHIAAGPALLFPLVV